MGVFRAVMITGSPGIGKTTSAHLCAKLEGFTPIELNASDTRSKKLVEVRIDYVSKYTYLAHSVGDVERDEYQQYVVGWLYPRLYCEWVVGLLVIDKG